MKHLPNDIANLLRPSVESAVESRRIARDTSYTVHLTALAVEQTLSVNHLLSQICPGLSAGK
jgi:hypothetical protein